MTKKEKINAFDPSGVGLKNGSFIGLPFDEDDASVVLLPVPWDVTVSYNDGTSTAARNILEASSQLDLYDADVKEAWKMGIYMRPLNEAILKRNQELRTRAKSYIHFLEQGGDVSKLKNMQRNLDKINEGCLTLKNWVYEETRDLLKKGKIVGLVGGDHSTPLGYLEALAEHYDDFGVLQIDAHLDLRKAYEGFTYSHASIFYNALEINSISKFVQVGIRDYCQAELDVIESNGKRNKIFFDHKIKHALYDGATFKEICKKIIKQLPEQVYISFDIDGLQPSLCPNTGTPVPGGLELEQVFFLFLQVLESGRKIIGFDLVEVAGEGHEWEGNVGARILYKLANLAGKSKKMI